MLKFNAKFVADFEESLNSKVKYSFFIYTPAFRAPLRSASQRHRNRDIASPTLRVYLTVMIAVGTEVAVAAEPTI
jgi:hypothetical protein